MNSVHERGPNGDPKISSVRKSVQKAQPDAQAPSKPSRHAQVRTGAPRRAHGCRVVAVSPVVSWQGAGRIVGQLGRVAAIVSHACCARCARYAPRALARPTTAPAVARPRSIAARACARAAQRPSAHAACAP